MALKKSSTSAARTAPKSSKASTAGQTEKEPPTSSGEPSIDAAILEHLGRYRLSILAVLARLFFDGNEGRASGAFGRLQRLKKIAIRPRVFANGYSYYQLTEKGCAEAGVSTDRARSRKGLGVARDLGVLWFATMTRARRLRLREDQLPEGCPTPPGNPPHVAEELSPGKWRIHRLYVVGEETDHESPFREIKKVADAMRAMPQGSDFLRSGAYGFAVIVHEEAKKRRFEEALPNLMKALPDGSRVVIETAPSPNNLQLFL